MNFTPCKSRSAIQKIVNNPDGTVSAFVLSQTTGQLAPYQLTKPCCENLNTGTTKDVFFDIETQTCRWAPSVASICAYTTPYELVLNTTGSDGSYFWAVPDETCTLSIDFDYLFKFDCEVLGNFISKKINTPCQTLNDVFEGIGASMTLDIVQQSGGVTTLKDVYTKQVFKPIGSGLLNSYLINNSGSTGFYICSDNAYYTACTDLNLYDNRVNLTSKCKPFVRQILTSLTGVPSDSFASNWRHFHAEITDTSILSAITNQKIKITVNVSGTCIDMCVLLDNIKLNKNCTKVEREDIYVTQSPGFELDRIIDNKKSWVSNSGTTHRVFNITKPDGTQPIRHTDYYLENERQILNSKEIDLDINIAKAVETDVWCYISDNPCLLTGVTIGTTTCIKDAYSGGTCVSKTYCCSEYCGDANINLNALLIQPLSAVTTIEDFEYYITSELIDAKNRQTITSYPTLRLLYDRYVNSLNFCGTKSAKFDYFSMNDFANLIGNYWVDLIEQVIPATAIWGSTRVYTNTMFDEQKFKYKAYTTFFGTPSFMNVLSPATGATCTTSADTTVILSGASPVTPGNYSTVYLKQMNSGSEFIGTVTIMGSNSPCGKNSINECELTGRIDDKRLINNTLMAVAVGPTTGTVTYVWTTPSGEFNTQSVTYTTTGTYSVLISDDCCETTASITIK